MIELLTDLTDVASHLRGGAVAVGNFDGVHRGHAALIARLLEMSRTVGGPSIVMTFNPPPVAILVPDRPPTPPLTSIPRRAELLGRLGVDALVAYPTDRKLLDLSPQAFFEEKLRTGLGIKGMVEGPNFRFGKDRAGDTNLLAELCQQASIGLEIVRGELSDEAMISSTRIRKEISSGQILAANAMLTEPYLIEGIVVKGESRGAKLGFPTANLEALRNMIPHHGVYAGMLVLQGKRHCAAVHIGPNPTFGEDENKVEVHILDWTGDLYGEHLQCSLLAEVRPVKKFESVDDLKQQLQLDLQHCRQAFAAHQG